MAEEKEVDPVLQHQQEEAVKIVLAYIKAAPTYSWDGIPETAKVTGVAPPNCPNCWAVSISFESRHGGYGNRTGKMVAEVITPHIARVVVQDGVVKSADLDNWQWDEMRQVFLGGWE